MNHTVYHCSSLKQVFNLLAQSYSSVDIVLDPGIYNLTSSYNVTNLHHIRISSKNATIQCGLSVDDSGTGIAFIRVSNLTIEHVNIIGCGMRHASTVFGKDKIILVRSALFVQNSTSISLCNMSISNSNGTGLIMYDTNGTVSITETSFINNKLNVTEQGLLTAGGGGIYIHFTNCTSGLVACDPNSNLYNKHTMYVIDKCIFQNNNASYPLNDSDIGNIPSETSVTFGSGGGISVWFYGNASNNIIHILHSSFINNSAGLGGGINIRNKQNAYYNFVKIAHCFFTNNTSSREGGGAGLSMGYETYQDRAKTTHNKYIVDNCSFTQNQAVNGVGGGVTLFGSRMQHPTNHFTICNSHFAQNKALFGSAIEVNRQYYESILEGTTFSLTIKNCSFINNSLDYPKLLSTKVSSVGAVATSGVNIIFKGSLLFSGNNSTALAVEGAVIEFYNNSQIKFYDNNGVNGGGILLTNDAWMNIYPNCSVHFVRNTAMHYGGAIYVKLSTHFDYVLSHVCFFRYYLESVPPDRWHFNFTFINNTAGNSDNSVFVTTLKPCRRAYKQGFIKTLLVNGNMHQHPPHNTTPNVIVTAPDKFNFSTNGTLAIIPGEVFNLTTQLRVVDEQGQTVKPIYFIAACIGPLSPYVMPLYHLTNGSIQIAGKQGETCHLQLQTHEIATTIQITMSKCPPGFMFNDNELLCECKVDGTPAIKGCNLATFQAYLDPFYWIGYQNISQNHTKDNNVQYMLYSFCPYRFCYNKTIAQHIPLPHYASQSSLDHFVCSNSKRTGILCAKCIDGYSVTMNSPTFICHHCRNQSLGVLYLVLSYILPVSLLFYFIMAYNIRMTTGPIGAYLFFSQIISSQFPFMGHFSDEYQATSSVVIAIYSISNLNFFHHSVFSYCLFSSAGTVDILAFNLLLSLYPVLLVFVYFLFRRFCNWTHHCRSKFRLSRKSVTHGICAFLILSFAKINVLAFGLLKSVDMNYMNGTLYKRVVYFQGDIEYFRNVQYNVYATGSLFIIAVVILIPTLILVLHPIMITVVSYFEWGDSKCVGFVNKFLLIHKLKPVLDSFQGDYKDNLSIFAGLHSFLYRIVFFSIMVAASTPDVDHLLLLMMAFFLVILLIHVLVMPFKNYIDNAAYSLAYLSLLALLITEHLSTYDESLEMLSWLEIGLSLLPLTCAILHCTWKLLVLARMLWNKRRLRESEMVRTIMQHYLWSMLNTHYLFIQYLKNPK